MSIHIHEEHVVHTWLKEFSPELYEIAKKFETSEVWCISETSPDLILKIMQVLDIAIKVPTSHEESMAVIIFVLSHLKTSDYLYVIHEISKLDIRTVEEIFSTSVSIINNDLPLKPEAMVIYDRMMRISAIQYLNILFSKEMCNRVTNILSKYSTR